MCLAIDKKVRNNHHKENGYCVAYKIILRNNKPPCFMSYKYKVGINHAKLDKREMALQGVYNPLLKFHGLHLILSLEEAKAYRYNNCPDTKIIKVFYKPEDVIAYGHSVHTVGLSAKYQGRSVVVKSCLIKSLEATNKEVS
jgi:hypothetical protein